MSAFLCSANHLSALVNIGTHAGRDGRDLLRFFPQYHKDAPLDADGRFGPEQLFGLLLQTNLDSLGARYGAKAAADDAADAAPRYNRNFSAPNAIALLKAIDCYAYQACEHDGWERSLAKAWCDRLRSTIISKLPGYEAAPWGF